jgi:hypothetical protein
MFYRDGDVPSSLRQKKNSRVVERLCGAPKPRPWHFHCFKGAESTEALAQVGENRGEVDEGFLFLSIKNFRKIF